MPGPIDVLRANRLLDTPDAVRAFDEALAAVPTDPAVLPALLAVFTDASAQHEAMWGLVHRLEDFEVRDQLAAMVEALPSLEAEAAEWVRILHYRILNHAESRATLTEVLAADPPNADLARGILEEIARDEPDPLRSSALAVLGR